MIKTKIKSFAAAAAMAVTAQAAASEELTVAYFLEWPMPFPIRQGNRHV